MTARTALHLEGLEKHFGSVAALDGADLHVRAGEVHGLLGQNGCGKSTLVKVLTGYHTPDAARRAEVWGSALDFPVRSPQALGIAVIHQDLALVDTMTVVENIGISTSYGARAFAPVKWRNRRSDTQTLLDELGLDVDCDAPVAALPAADRAGVAVARALLELRTASGKQLLVLDEPTAYLPAKEAERVMAMIRSVARSGSAVVFISHRLGEVMHVCDRATIMRDGRTVQTVDVGSSSPRQLIAAMLGRELGDFYPPRVDRVPGEVLLTGDDLHASVLDGVDLTLREGEVLGVTGLVGQGQQELPYVLAGAAPCRSGEVRVAGELMSGADTRARLRAGLVLVPANRKRDGLWLDATAAENISLPALDEHVVSRLLRPRREHERASELFTRLGVRPDDPQRVTSGFSGGNQQKVVLAKWLQSDPRVLVLDEPTQGVDAGAKREILALVRESVIGGAGVLLCSSDHEEVAHMCTRVLVLREGRVVAQLEGDDLTEETILHHCNAVEEATA